MDENLTLDAGMSRQIRSWLHDTAAELPDDPALFAGIKASLRAPRPRPWTRPFRPGTLRTLSVSLGAALAIGLVGLAFGMPGPDSRSPAVGAAPSMSPVPLPEGSIPPGRYVFPRDAVPLAGHYEVSLDVPEGWSNDNGGWALTKGGDAPAGATVELDIIERLMVDPCSQDVTVDVPPGSSLESFAAILTSWGSETTGRTPRSPTTTEAVFATFDGRPGVELTVLTPADVVEASCTEGHYVLWGDEAGGRYIQGAGESMRVRVDPGRFGTVVPRRWQLSWDARRAPRRAAGDARLGAHRQSTGTAVGSGLANPLTVARLQGDIRDDAPPVTGGASHLCREASTDDQVRVHHCGPSSE